MNTCRKFAIPVLFVINSILAFLPLITVYLISLEIDVYELRTALTEYPYLFIIAMMGFTSIILLLHISKRTNLFLVFGFAVETVFGSWLYFEMYDSILTY